MDDPNDRPLEERLIDSAEQALEIAQGKRGASRVTVVTASEEGDVSVEELDPREELERIRAEHESSLIGASLVREDIREALDGWGDGSRPHLGGFLEAVLSNDLKEACGRADAYNLRTLPAIVAYCYNKLPAASWGSPKRVQEWKEIRTAEQERAAAAEAGGYPDPGDA